MPDGRSKTAFEGGIAALSALLRELALPENLLSPLLAHASAVAVDSDRLGLVSERTLADVVTRHTADSLLFALARRPEQDESWVDVGSGAGFPGLVLACCFADARFTLIEPQRRRAGFLEVQLLQLGLDNAEVLAARASDLDAEYDVATARALAEPAIALEALRSLVRPEGTVLLAVGDQAVAPQDVDDLDVSRPGVDSPGRLFMIAESRGGA
jgi:16S rRNA (guanine527-N7)-methyltransferase